MRVLFATRSVTGTLLHQSKSNNLEETVWIETDVVDVVDDDDVKTNQSYISDDDNEVQTTARVHCLGYLSCHSSICCSAMIISRTTISFCVDYNKGSRRVTVKFVVRSSWQRMRGSELRYKRRRRSMGGCVLERSHGRLQGNRLNALSAR